MKPLYLLTFLGSDNLLFVEMINTLVIVLSHKLLIAAIEWKSSTFDL